MATVHSHYENLKVPRDAPPEAIRAAYRALTKKYHPDRNHGDAEAERIMSVINVAYAVLADPAARAEHDAWITQAEQTEARIQPLRISRLNRSSGIFVPARPAYQRPTAEELAAARDRRASQARQRVHLKRYWFVYVAGLAAAATIAVARLLDSTALPAMPYGPNAATPVPNPIAAQRGSAGPYTRPATAPNGRPWPQHSGYLEGYPVQNTKGASEVRVDNSKNDSDVLAKLYSLDGPQPQAVRVFLIRAHGRFTLATLSTGTYDLRFRNLGDGRLSRSQFFALEEVSTPTGPRVTNLTLNLFDTPDAALHNYGLNESEF